ncbi:MAG: preprotein translocase subunit YajC [Ruminococcus sp.]|nr:preprotein translocase subunit YajC [Ruminococcus sp.]
MNTNITINLLASAQTAALLQMFLPLALLLVFFYFFIIRPQRKQEKQDKEMRENLEIGDEIITNGGIVGLVCQIKEDTIVIETGGDRSKIRLKKWAIAKVVTEHDN